MIKLDLLPGDAVLMTVDREGQSALLTESGIVSAYLWVIKGACGIRAALRATLPGKVGGAHRAVTLEAIFNEGDLAKVFQWLGENDTVYAVCHGLGIKDPERIKKLLRADLAEKVRLKAGELGQRPGVTAGMRVAVPAAKPQLPDTGPIPLCAAPAETTVFEAGGYRELR